jgi:DNA modification methylase
MDEIEDLMTQFHVPGEIVEDEAPEPPEEPITKPGDLWLLGRHRLLCGDATSPDDVARLMNGKKADKVFTDPPYDLDISYAANLFNNYKGHCFVMNTINRIVDLIILNRKEFSRLFVVDFRIPHLVSNSAPMDRVDFIAEFKNSKSKFVNLKDGFSTLIECAKVHSNKAKGNFGHAQAKRVELPAQFIEHYSRKGEIVLDLFGGSGSTLIACEQLNRVCYMMEIDPVYCDVIVKRWENLTGQKAVLAE